MRDPKRIDYILDLLKQGWVKNPDFRFCQLMINLSHYIIGDGDLYYLEDDEFARWVIDYFDLDEVKENTGCAGCIYEDADGSTVAISNCVCCSRNVEFAKNDYYKSK